MSRKDMLCARWDIDRFCRFCYYANHDQRSRRSKFSYRGIYFRDIYIIVLRGISGGRCLFSCLGSGGRVPRRSCCGDWSRPTLRCRNIACSELAKPFRPAELHVRRVETASRIALHIDATFATLDYSLACGLYRTRCLRGGARRIW